MLVSFLCSLFSLFPSLLLSCDVFICFTSSWPVIRCSLCWDRVSFNHSSLISDYSGELWFSLGFYILRISNCLFHFAIIQGEEWEGAYSGEVKERKGLAGLCAGCIKMFSPFLAIRGQWCPFKGALRYKPSLQRHANYFCTFQLCGTKLLPPQGASWYFVSDCGFPLSTHTPCCIDFNILKN